MSLIEHVIDLVEDMGNVTVDDLLPRCRAYTREQVMRSLREANYQRRIKQVVRQSSGAAGGGSRPAVYGPTGELLSDRKPLPTRTEPRGDYGIGRVASVWELAGRSA